MLYIYCKRLKEGYQYVISDKPDYKGYPDWQCWIDAAFANRIAMILGIELPKPGKQIKVTIEQPAKVKVEEVKGG